MAAPEALAPVADSPALKPWLTARARATLAGFTATLTRTDDGRPELIVSRWALTRAFTDIAELDRWLQRVGAPA